MKPGTRVKAKETGIEGVVEAFRYGIAYVRIEGETQLDQYEPRELNEVS